MRNDPDPVDLARRVAEGDRRSLARAISLVEDDRPGAAELLGELYPRGGGAHVVGFTGWPGSGKSTLVDRVIAHLRPARKVAVLAIDPASPFTGGALLGDRIRMQRHTSDLGVYVRSMSNRGRLGGVADATFKALTVIEAAGYDPVLVETVGVGQAETEIVEVAHTTVVVLAPGWGDDVQVAKAGLLEAADVFCINKDDQPGADRLAAALEAMLDLADPSARWRPPVVRCSAELDRGVDLLWEAVEAHRRHLAPDFGERARLRARAELTKAALGLVTRRVEAGISPDLVERVAARRQDPWSAARELIGS
jgi:LAO/AO transport system kinase